MTLELACRDLTDAEPFSIPMWSLKRAKGGRWETCHNALWTMRW